jgi:hypothetical protein
MSMAERRADLAEKDLHRLGQLQPDGPGPLPDRADLPTGISEAHGEGWAAATSIRSPG